MQNGEQTMSMNPDQMEMMMDMDMEMDMDGGANQPPPKKYNNPNRVHDYDLFVIGGGSGGISTAKEAADLGAKVALADYVDPTPIGTQWGLGGTCVNVGCIPKKLMHFSSIMGDYQMDQRESGWELPEKPVHNWGKMVKKVQDHIKSLNWGYKVALLSREIDYFNAYASLIDAHTVKMVDKNGKVSQVTAENILIAVGGRPNYPEIPGAKEFGITSDDLFSLKNPPGRTLVVGASYVALECAGFLAGFGYDTTVMVRSILLRGFDQDMAERIGAYMEKHRTKFIKGAVPLRLSKSEDGKILVDYEDVSTGMCLKDTYDTVLFAVGRYAVTGPLNLPAIGVKVEANGKIDAAEDERTNVPNIFAIGDVLYGKLELTPTAIMSGRLLARRLFGGELILMDYVNVPTTVFTPLEYGTCGMAEDDAQQKYGKENISVYHTSFKPLEWSFSDHREESSCYVKVIVNKLQNDKVIGFHILSPNAGEITQGLAIAMKCGLTKQLLDATVGIHPTIAEEVTGLTTTKEENPNAEKGGCCG